MSRIDDTLSQNIAAHDATENIDQNTAHSRIGKENLKGLCNFFFGSAAADIQKIRRLATAQLDDIHGRHRQAGAVNHASDITIQGDIGELKLACFDFARVLLVQITQRDDIFMPIERIAIEVHLCVQCHDLTLFSYDDRVYLSDRTIGIVKGAIQRLHDSGHFADQLTRDVETIGKPPALKTR